MAQRSHGEQGVTHAHLLDVAPDDLRWIYPNIRMTITSNEWHNEATIKDLEQTYRMNKVIKGMNSNSSRLMNSHVAVIQIYS